MPPPEPDFYQGSSFPAFSGHISTFISSPGPPAYASASLSRHESVKTFSPTHPKLVSRDPPVPPSLAKKRRSIGVSAPPPQLKLARARSPSVRAQKDERGTTSRAGSEERRPVLTRKATARVVVNVRPPSPDAIPTGDGRLPATLKLDSHQSLPPSETCTTSNETPHVAAATDVATTETS